jgi:hypothetical protein
MLFFNSKAPLSKVVDDGAISLLYLDSAAPNQQRSPTSFYWEEIDADQYNL